MEVESRHEYEITPKLEEDRVWFEDIAPSLRELPRKVLDIWQYCVTEMVNNAIDHSDGKRIVVTVSQTAGNTRISLHDDGVGIFRKLQAALGLPQEREAILELAKGKLTTDPLRHSGQGIFRRPLLAR